MNAQCSTGKAGNIAASVGVTGLSLKRSAAPQCIGTAIYRPVIFEVLTGLFVCVCV